MELAKAQEPPAKSDKKEAVKTWGPLAAIFITIAVYFLSQFLAVLLYFVYGTFAGLSSEDLDDLLQNSVPAQFFLTLVVDILVAGLLWFYVKKVRHYGGVLRALGIHRWPKLKDLGFSAIGFGIYFLLLIAIQALTPVLFPGVDLNQEQQIGFENATGPLLLLVFISLVILPPVIEEILFRGFMYHGLRTKARAIPAAVITSLVFGAAHLELLGSGAPPLWIAMIDTFCLSLLLVWLRVRSGALWASVTVHALKNAMAFFFLFIYTGQL